MESFRGWRSRMLLTIRAELSAHKLRAPGTERSRRSCAPRRRRAGSASLSGRGINCALPSSGGLVLPRVVLRIGRLGLAHWKYHVHNSRLGAVHSFDRGCLLSLPMPLQAKSERAATATSERLALCFTNDRTLVLQAIAERFATLRRLLERSRESRRVVARRLVED